ncbi:MAG TPA: ABC transporter permease subunit [Opitutus sp.]|nr:ABC transporter permease subunit [Opitutus sp.]
MRQTAPVLKREFLGYFRSPVAYVFLIVFLIATIGCAFFLGQFFRANTASLESYFIYLPWLFLFLIPAAGMRLWSEEMRTGTLELLFTLPVTTLDAVIGKFLAAWAFLSIAILLSFPLVITVSYLGHPDWGVLVASYLGAILMAGSFLSVCSLVSALTKNQIISFVISVLVCFVLDLLGASVFTGFLGGYLPVPLVDVISNFSFITHFDAFMKGIIDPKDVIFFLSLTGFSLFLNVVALER